MPQPASSRKGVLERVLSVAAEVRPGEGATAVLLAVNVFVLLSAYYTIRPLRSALLLPVQIALPGGRVMTGPEIQSYTGAILAALFLVIVPLYSALASRVDRMRLINSVTMFFVVTILEVAAGALSAVGFLLLLLTRNATVAFWGALIAAANLIALFFGQRLSKDYAGAAALVPYFLLAITAIYFLAEH